VNWKERSVQIDELLDSAVARYRQILDEPDPAQQVSLREKLGCYVAQLEAHQLRTFRQRVNELRDERGLDPEPE
jgi:hypothetical protein